MNSSLFTTLVFMLQIGGHFLLNWTPSLLTKTGFYASNQRSLLSEGNPLSFYKTGFNASNQRSLPSELNPLSFDKSGFNASNPISLLRIETSLFWQKLVFTLQIGDHFFL
jgi:hypothetical protein